MSKPTIALDVGHGIKSNGVFDPGARSKDGKWTEQQAGDVVVAEAAKLLRQAGVKVYSEAHSDDPNFVGSVKAANTRQVDLAVTIHHDWNQAPSGGFGFWYPGSVEGRRCADAILAAYKRNGLPVRNPWHKSRGNLYYLRNTSMPSVLWECGRIGEYSKAQLLTVAKAIAQGIAEYLDITLTAPERKTTESGTQVRNADEAFAEIARIVKHDYGNRVDEADARAVVAKVRKLAG